MKAIIIAGGSLQEPAFYKPYFTPDTLIICADGGYQNAVRLGVVPRLVIGDFDSFPLERLPKTIQTLVLPVEKDRTDLHECILYALGQGAEEILLFGALGTRLDHSLAAISLLCLGLRQGVRIRLLDSHNELFLLQGSVEIPRRPGWKLSLLPLTKVRGIDAEGLYYPLHGQAMDWGNPYGVSNEFTAETAKIRAAEGILMVIFSRD